MTLSSRETDELLQGRGTVIGPDGGKIGSVGQVYVDDRTDRPKWITVHTGLFGTRESFVPLAGAVVDGQNLRVRYPKDVVRDAPQMDRDGRLSPEEEHALYRHYGTGQDEVTAGGQDADVRTVTTLDRPGPGSGGAMTRSEEQLRVGVEEYESGRVRLRKYVITETATTTVPVSREEVRIVREPITRTTTGDVLDAPVIQAEEVEIVLHKERPVLDKEVVPVERVRLNTRTVTEEQTVTENVRRERIDLEGLDDATTPAVHGTGSSQ